MSSSRQARIRGALALGEELHLDNRAYLETLRCFTDELLRTDLGSGDLTANALGLVDQAASARVLAKAPGIVAGMDEFCWYIRRHGMLAAAIRKDGDQVQSGDILVEMQGRREELLSHERVGINLLQRMSGIATMTGFFQELVAKYNPDTLVVGTRKTPWGLLDKRAIHLGGGGTHRLGLWDAILIKNNHLALLASDEKAAACTAVRRAWKFRHAARFIEIEVRCGESAIMAAQTFRALRETCSGMPSGMRSGVLSEQHSDERAGSCACIVMLDNMRPEEVSRIVLSLRERHLLDEVLIEVSGNISEENAGAYADCGVDAISIGALTHSAHVLDLCQRL